MAYHLEPDGRIIGYVDVEEYRCFLQALAQTNTQNCGRSDEGIRSIGVIVMPTDPETLPLQA
jgi:hypothetical protein